MIPRIQEPSPFTQIRGTQAQDRALPPEPWWRRRRRALVGAGLALAALTLAALPAWRALSGGERRVPLAAVRIASVERGRFVSDVSAQGTVLAALSPTLVATAPGSVHFIARAGEAVRKGQLLARVESPELESEAAREKASLENQEATLARESIEIRRKLLQNRETADLAALQLQAAEREFRRAEGAKAQHVFSDRDYEKARDELGVARLASAHATDSAALEEESLKLELRMRRLDRDRQKLLWQELARRLAGLELRSPVDGIVGTLAVAERATVALNAPILSVVDPSVYEVEFMAPDVYAPVLRPGLSAEVTVGTRSFAATVAALSPEVRQGQIVGRLRFAGPQPPGLNQNQRLPVRVVIDARDGVLKLERGAFAEAAGGRFAYRVAGELAERVPIELGASSATEIEVLKGLAPGDRVIVSGTEAFEGAPRLRLTH